MVDQWSCAPPVGYNQKWLLDPIGPNTYLLFAFHSGKCLDVPSGSLADGV